MSNQCIVKVDHFNMSFYSLFDYLVEQTKWVLSCLWASLCNAWSVYCESWSLWRELSFAVWSHDHLITWSCCLWASQCNAWSVYVSITCTYRAVTALLMRLFNSSDKHSLQKIHSQHLVQINLVVNLCLSIDVCFSSHCSAWFVKFFSWYLLMFKILKNLCHVSESWTLIIKLKILISDSDILFET